MMNTCAARGCARSIKPGLLMCAPHWYLVPKSVQREVLNTWRAFNASKSSDALAAYRAARQKAIDAL
jgi:hypothetical protein